MTNESSTLTSPANGQQAPKLEDSNRCLDNDEILSFVQGFLSGRQMDRVHAHVDQCGLCQRLVADAAHALDADLPVSACRGSFNTVLQPDAIVGGRYRIVRLVGRGGMGEVYEAFDIDLQERLALKTVTSTACDNSQAVRALKAEVQLARRVTHPNVCRIYDFRTHRIESSNAVVNFIVMEFVEGECLGRKLRERGAMPIGEVQAIVRLLLLGLRAAHHAGILHRDLKSDNIMLRREECGKVAPVILDFGLAKILNETESVLSTITQGHGVVGTIGYMSPEQLEGRPLSKASDIYSLGMVWYEMLTGQLAFTGETPIAAAMARLREEPSPPSSRVQGVPQWLDEIVLRCLSRSQRERFGSPDEVLEALARQSLRVRKLTKKQDKRRAMLLVSAPAVLGGALLGGWLRARSSMHVEVRAATPVLAERNPLASQNVAGSGASPSADEIGPAATNPPVTGAQDGNGTSTRPTQQTNDRSSSRGPARKKVMVGLDTGTEVADSTRSLPVRESPPNRQPESLRPADPNDPNDLIPP